MPLQSSDKFNLTDTKFFNYRCAIHTVIFKGMLSLLLEKALITLYF